jgi:hypothetical protein
MDVRALLVSTLIVALLSSTSSIASEPVTPADTTGNIEPVLVRVNAQGKVTEVTPAYPLSHELMQLLRANLDAMIHKPAVDNQGKPVPSQFIIKLALQSDQRTAGDYSAHFAYVSATPVPAGSWYWTRDAQGQLVLASQGNMNNSMSAFNANAGTVNSMPTSSSAPSSSGHGGR